MNYVGEKLNIGNDMEKWYNVSARQIQELGGTAAIKLYKYSPSALIMSAFP